MPERRSGTFRQKKTELVGLNYRNGVPPLKKLPERRSATFRLNYSTGARVSNCFIIIPRKTRKEISFRRVSEDWHIWNSTKLFSSSHSINQVYIEWQWIIDNRLLLVASFIPTGWSRQDGLRLGSSKHPWVFHRSSRPVCHELNDDGFTWHGWQGSDGLQASRTGHSERRQE